ncbi:MAG: hypothetical protein U9P71_04750 [Campylobacterota bacterium]|nr:hypothetical protein [Campylobacterota bacterium]
MNFTGLSLEQAPPLWAPARFFITAPLFAIFASVALLFLDTSTLSSRYSVEVIALTHLFTIGFFTFVMLGALQQMLPVLAGVALPNALRVAQSSHLLLIFGTLSLFMGLLLSNAILMITAAVLLFLGFAIILTAVVLALLKVDNFNATVKAMSVSVGFAVIIVLLGLHLLGGHASSNITELSFALSNVHSVWAIFGFAGILVIGVSFQVLPMFYVTPDFSKFFNSYGVSTVAVALLFWLLLNLFLPNFAVLAKLFVALLFFIFGFEVIKKFQERKRKLSDVTLWYWQLSAVSLIAGILIWSVDEFISFDLSLLTSILIGGGFLLSVMNGMLYKIIPFLVWFHLNAMGYMTIPTMREMFKNSYAELQFVLHVITLLLLLPFAFGVDMLKIAAVTMLLSSLILLFNLLSALKIYSDTKKRTPDFDMSMMQS